ncbi:dTDP-4-dehydrorhamnose reductase [Morganella morganii subsp. morganii]|uniref:dTDP-4-dehydrorhamnose reductase n=1 Tax=Morganella morganii TaxID=582 RepID=UPI001BD9C68D|nr:dTDP-4-dehydrorhamnose reductase [Morganella morganii]MBT0395905.1 dTDP-4-dehydrorhamnose reductase [Morganella morganii subsp. morganii]
MKILIFGKNGQVGWELQRSLSLISDMISLDRRSSIYAADFNNIKAIKETIHAIKPDVIVNAVAYTNVDKAESDYENAFLINAECVKILAQEASKVNSWLVHYSSDYVFNGNGDHSWTELDSPDPLNAYGESKLLGELNIEKYCEKHLIFRTSWVYAKRGNNFLKTILKLINNKESISVIEDQIGAPTSAELLADCTAHAILRVIEDPSLAGLYHISPYGETSWFNYATYILSEAKKLHFPHRTDCQINRILTKDYNSIAIRPLNSRLSKEKIIKNLKFNIPNWEVNVSRTIDELNNLRAILL